MEIFPTLTKCIHCGTLGISESFDVKQGRIFICWHCGHRVAVEATQSVRCIQCKSNHALEFYDDRDGVVIECPDCGHHDFSGQISVEYPRTVECPQCGNPQASEFEDDGSGFTILCLNCGRQERKGLIWDDKDNICGWKHEVKFGAGCLQYRQNGEAAFAWQPLHTAQEAAECEKVTHERLRNGEYVAKDTCLTRWDLKTRQTVTVLFVSSNR